MISVVFELPSHCKTPLQLTTLTLLNGKIGYISAVNHVWPPVGANFVPTCTPNDCSCQRFCLGVAGGAVDSRVIITINTYLVPAKGNMCEINMSHFHRIFTIYAENKFLGVLCERDDNVFCTKVA